jgi:hypothetical protein
MENLIYPFLASVRCGTRYIMRKCSNFPIKSSRRNIFHLYPSNARTLSPHPPFQLPAMASHLRASIYCVAKNKEEKTKKSFQPSGSSMSFGIPKTVPNIITNFSSKCLSISFLLPKCHIKMCQINLAYVLCTYIHTYIQTHTVFLLFHNFHVRGTRGNIGISI